MNCFVRPHLLWSLIFITQRPWILLELIMWLDVAAYWLAFVRFGERPDLHLCVETRSSGKFRGILWNFPEVSYFIIILFSGNCAFAKILSVGTHLQTRARNNSFFFGGGRVVRLSLSAEWISYMKEKKWFYAVSKFWIVELIKGNSVKYRVTIKEIDIFSVVLKRNY